VPAIGPWLKVAEASEQALCHVCPTRSRTGCRLVAAAAHQVRAPMGDAGAQPVPGRAEPLPVSVRDDLAAAGAARAARIRGFDRLGDGPPAARRRPANTEPTCSSVRRARIAFAAGWHRPSGRSAGASAPTSPLPGLRGYKISRPKPIHAPEQAAMLNVDKLIARGRGLAAALLKRAPSVELDWETRCTGRFDATDSSGRRLGVVLAPGQVLRGGDVLVAEDGSLVRVIAAPQPVLVVRRCAEHGTPGDLLRAAYHLGRRHVPLELQPDHLKLAPDPVLAGMLRRQHLIVSEERGAFEPEVGAEEADRSGHGHAHATEHGHGHAHGPTHDHGHVHGHDHGHAHATEHVHGHTPGHAHGHGHDHGPAHDPTQGPMPDPLRDPGHGHAQSHGHGSANAQVDRPRRDDGHDGPSPSSGRGHGSPN
jgi:urease accessory protein